MAWRYLYDILGVAPTASAAQIARAYRWLADQYHPALNPTPDAAAHAFGRGDTLPEPPGFPGLSVAIDRLVER